MGRHIVVAFRMPPAGMAIGPEGSYLTRARSMCSRGEALGGQLVAWSSAIVAMAWDEESMEESMLLAASVQEEALSSERAWACGLAEGELEPLAPDGARMHLAWGEALLSAVSLARIARAGEVLIDGDVRALRAGQLSLVGARAATDAGQRVRGWKLDLAHPWKRAVVDPDVTDRLAPPDLQQIAALDETLEAAALQFIGDELSTAEVLEIVEATAAAASEPLVPPASRRRGSKVSERIRQIAAGGDDGNDAVEALASLRRGRAEAEIGSVAARCQAALALAMALTLAGRTEEALLEALDAMARARELGDARAVAACLALLAKLYAGAGRVNEAAALREAVGVA